MTPEAAAESSRRDDILEAALGVFAHYGFAKTSLDAIAREAGLSRTALYHHFRNKEEIFRAAAEALHERSLADAERAVAEAGPLAVRLRGALEARSGRFFDVVHGSRHGAELADESSRLCGDLAAASGRRFQKLVARLLRQADAAGEIDLAGSRLGAEAAADLLLLCADGLKGPRSAPPTRARFRARLERFVGLAVGGLGGRRPAS